MKNICVFKRYEYKYLLSAEQYRKVLSELEKHMHADIHGCSTIQSLYYDTDDFHLVRRSLEKPVYKEKVRLRSYGLARGDEPVFLELKKKYRGVVFKRRIELTAAQADADMFDRVRGLKDQIAKELAYAAELYRSLAPRVLLLYDRTALYGDGDLRVTFDANVRYRTDRLSLGSGLDGIPLRTDGKLLMEIKTSTAIPLWLCRLLGENGIHKISFSKYGEVYKIIKNTENAEVKQVG